MALSTDAIKLWSQLSLSPSLEIPALDDFDETHVDLSIVLTRSSPTAVSTVRSRGWVLDNFEVKAPSSVLSVQLNRLHISLSFYTQKGKDAPLSSRRKLCHHDMDAMLLDNIEEMTRSHLEVSKESGDVCMNDAEFLMNDFIPQSASLPPDCSIIPFGDPLLHVQEAEKRSDDLDHCCQAQDISDVRVLSAVQKDAYELDDILSFPDDEPPLLCSQPSTTLSSSSTASSAPRKRIATLETPNLLLSSSFMLTSAALHLLIGGTACKRSLQSLKLKSTLPKAPLSSLVPALFCPQFNPIMARNARFLPTISQTISSSLVRNCQGVGLRSKLMDLANLPSPGEEFGFQTLSGEQGSVERLRAVVQTRIWSMMQRKLSDSTTNRKIKWNILDARTMAEEDEVEDSELLFRSNTNDGDPFMDAMMHTHLSEFIEDDYVQDYDDDDELLLELLSDEDEGQLLDLLSDDEGLLSYFDEMESLEVEKQTDGMLLGSDSYYQDNDSDVFLLLDENNEETMLL